MTPAELLDELAIAGVVLYLKDGKLKYKAESGAYTDERRAIVSEHREALIEALKAQALGGPDRGAVEKSRGAVQKSSDPAAWPWHPDSRPIADPEAHCKAHRAMFPPAIAPTLEAIAKAWKRCGVKVVTKTTTTDGKRKEETETQHPLSLRREYERLVGWAIAEPATITPAWVAEQVARWDTTPSEPTSQVRITPHWARRWRELEEAGYVPGGRSPA